jgi:hypothetical protein
LRRIERRARRILMAAGLAAGIGAQLGHAVDRIDGEGGNLDGLVNGRIQADGTNHGIPFVGASFQLYNLVCATPPHLGTAIQ